MADLEDILEAVWSKVRKSHLFPELPPPVWDEGTPRVGLNMTEKKISISRRFVEKMSLSINPEEVLEGLLDHAVSHYLYCPWSFATYLKLYAAAKNSLKDTDMAQKGTDRFMDVVADSICVSRKETPIPKIYRQLEKSILDETVYALCQIIWDVDLGVQDTGDVVMGLARLPYMDRSSWMESIRRFVELLQPFLEMERDNETPAAPPPMGCHSIQQYSAQEIMDGLKELSLDVTSLSDFSELVHDFEVEITEAFESAGNGLGDTSINALDTDIIYYMKLAENYLLPIRKAPMGKSGFMYPCSHVPWEVGRPYQDIDLWTSFGKIMPGITQTWKRVEGEVFGQEEGIPDCIVIIDSSGSMQNPRHSLSYAVLGAACACDTYLRNDARVAVYNFGDAAAGGRQVLAYSRCRKEIYESLCCYFGGGTHFQVEDIETLQKEGTPDIFLISDMQITNLEILIQYLNSCQNRVTAVHIGDNESVRKFCFVLDLRKNISIYDVKKVEDIPRIVLGKIRQYLY